MDEIQPCPVEPAPSGNSTTPYPLNASLGELLPPPRKPGTSPSAIARQKMKKERPEEYAKLLMRNNARYKKKQEDLKNTPMTRVNLQKQEVKKEKQRLVY